MSSCNAGPEAEIVAQDDAEVRVRVRADEPGPDSDDCADGLTVCLDAPSAPAG